eukprot:2126029-Amphidinium_carterae.2
MSAGPTVEEVEEPSLEDEFGEECYDEVSGAALPPDLVAKAKQEEISICIRCKCTHARAVMRRG